MFFLFFHLLFFLLPHPYLFIVENQVEVIGGNEYLSALLHLHGREAQHLENEEENEVEEGQLGSTSQEHYKFGIKRVSVGIGYGRCMGKLGMG